ncbi:MAG: hypothetical protein ACM3KM_02740, partial [Acidobacteriaceae bacterium]
VGRVEDVVKIGDELPVKIMEIDHMGRINLSHKVLLPKPEGAADHAMPERPDRQGGRPPFRPRNDDRRNNRRY